MADMPPMEGFLQQQLECSVCLLTFNLEARTPTALKCQHTFCKQCVDTLATKHPLTCPKCKRICDVENLVKNFALCDVLSELCQSCNSREIESRCDHCPQNLCATCLAAHDQLFQGEVKHNLDQVRREVRTLSDLTSDDSVFDKERTRAAAAIDQIQEKIQAYQDEIRKLEATLKNKIIELKEMNIDRHAKWQHELDVELVNCKAFLRKSDHTIERLTHAKIPRESLAETNTKALEFLSTLREYQTDAPTPTEYTFVESESSPNVGEITSPPATSSNKPTPVDYTRARSVAVHGSQGSGPEEFALECFVTCTDHSCIVSDTQNNRLKVYDTGLNLQYIFGEKGDQKHQFNLPTGLCVSPSGELYVSDIYNHRIKVYDKYFQLVRTFGSHGSGNDNVNQPMGLAFTRTGQLVVADAGNCRVKVLGADGSYIRNIGCKGQGPGQFAKSPLFVAITTDGHVLVNEANAARLLMFTLDGDYVRDITPNVPNTPNVVRILGFTTDCHGNIIIANRDNGNLIVLDSLGQLKCVVGKPGDQLGELSGPCGVAVNSNNILVYEIGNKRIQLFEI